MMYMWIGVWTCARVCVPCILSSLSCPRCIFSRSQVQWGEPGSHTPALGPAVMIRPLVSPPEVNRLSCPPSLIRHSMRPPETPVHAHCSLSPDLTPTSCPRSPFGTPWGHVKSERFSSCLIRQPRLTCGDMRGGELRQGRMRCLEWGSTVVWSWGI